MTRRWMTCALAAVISALPITASAQVKSVPYTWESVAIFGGGYVSGLVTHPTEKGLMYARTDIGGAYRWEPNPTPTANQPASGKWVALTDFATGETWNYTGVESIAVDPRDPNRVYAAVGTYTNNWASNGSILRSSNRGNTWEISPLPFKNGGNEDGRNVGERLAVDLNNGTNLLFGSRNNGLWQSTDQGATWNIVKSFPIKTKTNGTGISFVVFAKSSANLFVGVSGSTPSLYRSTDAGMTWTPIPGIPDAMLPSHAALSLDESTLYITYANAPGPNGMTRGGVVAIDLKTQTATDISPLKPTPEDQFGYSGITIDRQSPNTLLVSTNNRWARKDEIFRSTNSGKTWTPLGLATAKYEYDTAPYTAKSSPHWTTDVEIDPFDSGRAWFITGYGVWMNPDVRTQKPWQFENRGLEECVINDLASPAKGAHVISAMWDLNGFRHTSLTDSPKSGRIEPYGRCTSVDVAALNPDIMARVYGGDGTHGSFSTNNGETWTEFSSKPEIQGGKGDGTIAVSADGTIFVWSQEGQIPAWSADHGKTWHTSTGAPTGQITSDPTNPQRFYLWDKNSATVYISTDAGKTFTAGATSLPKDGGQLRGMPGAPDTLFLASNAGLLKSTDAGKTFNKVGEFWYAGKVGFGKPAPDTQTSAIYVVGKYAGQYGFYRSTDAGASWVRINDDAHQYGSINAITGDPKVYGRVYIGSANRGVIYGDPK